MSNRFRYIPLDEWKQKAIQGESSPDDLLLRKSFAGATSKTFAEETRRIQFTLSTPSVDRDRDTIDQQGWDITEYRQCPVVLWGHIYGEPSIGKSVELHQAPNRLSSIDEFATRDVYPFADTIYQLVKGGFLNAVSVGFAPRTYVINNERNGVDFTSQLLLEHSVVSVPSNPEALVEARSALGADTIAPYVAWCERVLDEWHGEAGIWVPKSKVEAAHKAAADHKTYSLGNPGLASTGSSEVSLTLVADMSDIRADINDHIKRLEAEASTEPVNEAHRTLHVPGDVSARTAPMSAEWKSPQLADFAGADTPFHTLSTRETKRIAGHFAVAKHMPPRSYDDLLLPHHNSHDGSVSWRGVASAASKLPLIVVASDDADAALAHLASHYQAFGRSAPWQRDPDAWEAYAKFVRAIGKDDVRDADLVNLLEMAGFFEEAESLKPEKAEQAELVEVVQGEVIDIDEVVQFNQWFTGLIEEPEVKEPDPEPDDDWMKSMVALVSDVVREETDKLLTEEVLRTYGRLPR